MREVTASFQPGRVYAIFGDNGAGKSTLLRVICGLAQPTAGAVLIFGSCERKVFTARLGYMGHAPLLYDEMTGMENLRYFAGLYGIGDSAHCDRAMASVGLDPALTRRVGDYSQGMRQRLSLARAAIHDPGSCCLMSRFPTSIPPRRVPWADSSRECAIVVRRYLS